MQESRAELLSIRPADAPKYRSFETNSFHQTKILIQNCSTDPRNKLSHNNYHFHNDCEIFLHISGNVTFIVENQTYPILPGNIIITRPHEAHHCIYRSNDLHRHICIYFSPAGNESMLGQFFNRDSGTGNLLSLPPDETNVFIRLCEELLQSPNDPLEDCYHFLCLLQALKHASSIEPKTRLSSDVAAVTKYIRAQYREKVTTDMLAREANVSVNTLGRHFSTQLGISPMQYLKQVRLNHAAKLLAGGSNVTEACYQSGFTDCSAFISQFRKAFDMTPSQYMKQFNHSEFGENHI